MSNFTEALDSLLGLEGGTSNDAADHGGLTKWGITQATLERAKDAGIVPQGVTIANMTRQQMEQIYFTFYWNAYFLGQLRNGDIASECFEQLVNFSSKRATMHFQKALNWIGAHPVVEDGILGGQTIRALNALNPTQIIPWIKAANGFQFMSYVEIVKADPSQQVFFVGWLRRITDGQK